LPRSWLVRRPTETGTVRTRPYGAPRRQAHAVGPLHSYKRTRKGPVVANVNPRLRHPFLGTRVSLARVELGHNVRDIGLGLGARSSRPHRVVTIVHVTCFQHDSGFPPRSPAQRWVPSGSGGGQPQSGSLAKYRSHCSMRSSGHSGRSFLISARKTMRPLHGSETTRCLRARRTYAPPYIAQGGDDHRSIAASTCPKA
jgi:hypothetical protein